MAAPYHSQGLLSRTLRWIRTQANEDQVSAKYTDAVVLEYFSQCLAGVLEAAYAVAAHPPYALYEFQVIAGQDRYVLPVNIKEVHRLYKRNAETGLPDWEILPGSKLAPGGPQISFEGTAYLRFTPTPETVALDGETLTLEYIPGGALVMHQNMTALWSADDDGLTGAGVASDANAPIGSNLVTVTNLASVVVGDYLHITGAIDGDVEANLFTILDTDAIALTITVDATFTQAVVAATWATLSGVATCGPAQFKVESLEGTTSYLLGEVDRRPRAFLGQMVRFLGAYTATVAPTGYNFFPVQERQIQTYNVQTGLATFAPRLDFDPNTLADKQVLIAPPDVNGRTYVIYEVVPAVDSALYWLGALSAAVAIATSEKRPNTVKLLNREFQRKQRDLLRRWSSFENRVGHHFDNNPDDYSDDGIS